MKRAAKLFAAIKRLWQQPRQQLLQAPRAVQLVVFCHRRLWQNNASAMSAALSFRTIFAMIPAIVLSLLILKSFGFLETTKEGIKGILSASGISQIVMESPASQPATQAAQAQPAASAPAEAGGARRIGVADLIEQQVDRIGGKLTFGALGPIGAALLIWSALTLLTTMERSLNRIFQAPRSRPLGRSILLYWAILTLVPILLTAASYAGGRFAQAVDRVPGMRTVLIPLGWLQPVIVGVLLLAAVYAFTPTVPVRYRLALLGAIVVAPLWLVAKWLFALYVRHVAGSGLYGALGLLPLFLVWLNTSWWLFLFGAELTYLLGNMRRMQAEELAEEITLGPADLLAVSAAVAINFAQGRPPIALHDVCRLVKLPAISIKNLLDHLVQRQVLCSGGDAEDPAYVLARPAERIAAMDVLGFSPSQLREDPARYEAEINRVLETFHDRAGEKLQDLTLADAIALP